MNLKKLLYLLICTLIPLSSYADVKQNALDKAAGKITDLIPGKGITEVSIEVNSETGITTGDGEDKINYSILGVRDLESTSMSNFFTQFSLMNQEINSDDRVIGNLGFGYRKLSDEKNFMYGVNTFYDRDLTEGQSRIGLGLEAKGSILDANINIYEAMVNNKVVKGINEQVLSGWYYNLTTQIPKAPWARFNYNGYSWQADKASTDNDGSIYSLELDVTKSIEITTSFNESNSDSIEDVYSTKINYIYPPKENLMVMTDGLSADFFEKRNMEHKLREKVKRQNKLSMEVQGSVILTKAAN